MKRFFVLFLLAAQFAVIPAFADEIIDAKGVVIPCKIDTVEGGLVHYKKDGNLYSFVREKDSVVFNDYVDVRTKIFKDAKVERYSGKVISKDAYGMILRSDEGNITIPWFRVKFIGVYKPN